MLWLVPFPSQRWLMSCFIKKPTDEVRPGSADAGRIVWAVSGASSYIPEATCLTQALAVQILLNRQGILADLRLGVGRNGDGQFKAHAWVEKDGRVLIGDYELESYCVIPPAD